MAGRSGGQRGRRDQSAWSLRLLLGPGERTLLQLRGGVGDDALPAVKPLALTTPHVASLAQQENAWSHVAVVVSSDGCASILVDGCCVAGPGPWQAGMPNGGPLVVAPRTDPWNPGWCGVRCVLLGGRFD
jgi:hypothetical protein